VSRLELRRRIEAKRPGLGPRAIESNHDKFVRGEFVASRRVRGLVPRDWRENGRRKTPGRFVRSPRCL